MEFFDRLREERKRLKLSQTQLAEVAGTTKNSQSNYEKGKVCPSATYLVAVATVGVDVQYVLTGQRSGITMLTEEDRALLALFHQAPSTLRQAALAVLAAAQTGGIGGVHVGRDNNGEITINGARR